MDHRTVTADDADAVVRLWAECGLTRPWNDPHDDLTRALEGAASTVLGAWDGTRLCGSVMVGHDGHRGWMYYLAVAPEHRGSGLGTRLVGAAEDWVHARGIPKVMLMVRAENAETLAFYERLGYADQGVSVLGRFLDPQLQQMREGSGTQEGTRPDATG